MQGIDNHLKNSDENITQNAAKRSEMDTNEELRNLDDWATNLCNRSTPGVHNPHAQNFANTQIENEML